MFYIIMIVLFLIFIALFYFVVEKQKKQVKECSKLLAELNSLNEIYKNKFLILQDVYKFKNECSSLQKYKNNCNNDMIFSFMCNQLRGYENIWKKLCSDALYNRKIYQNYINYLKYIKIKNLGLSYEEVPHEFLFMSKNRYLKIEEKLFFDMQLRPVIDLKVVLTVYYISPAGRNRYFSDFSMNEKYIEAVLNKIEENKRFEQSAKYQRQLMTNSKRYDILRRDNFRCQICGRSQSDGVKLEVDHIIPVSKGGKTVDSNLRTLCHECNQGKKDKYEQ